MLKLAVRFKKKQHRPEMSDGLTEYFKASVQRNLHERREFSAFGHVNVYVKDALPQNMEVTNIIQKLENSIPAHLVKDLELIIFGNFDKLKERGVIASYSDGAIYVISDQEDEDDVYADIVHEIAHCVEASFSYDIYGDQLISNEFLGKRLALYNVLLGQGIKFTKEPFMDVEYSEEFDNFLHDTVGYDKLHILTTNVFVSPYGATSLREYFANCFEHYFTDTPMLVKDISPAVYAKIQNLMEMNKNEHGY